MGFLTTVMFIYTAFGLISPVDVNHTSVAEINPYNNTFTVFERSLKDFGLCYSLMIHLRPPMLDTRVCGA